MTLWFILALMTAAAAFAVLWPLGRGARATGGDELAVYRDQMAEIERDREAGRIGAEEAAAARIEVSRRILAADASRAESRAAAAQPPLYRRRIVAVIALVLLPLGATALYGALGSPWLPGEPLAARLSVPPDRRSIETLVAQVEKHLDQHPTDARGWELLAPVYLRMGRFDDAVKARRSALTYGGETAERQSALGEALVGAAQGIVTADASAAFTRALQLDPKDAKARFYLGLAAEQDGRRDDAAKRWRDLIAQAPPDAPYLPFVREALARVDPHAANAAPSQSGASIAGAPGPNAAQIAAAASMTPEQRQDMIRGMVGQLAQRLKSNGADLDGWLRLMRAYMVLGEREKARAAAADARRALSGNPDSLRQIDETAKGLGVNG